MIYQYLDHNFQLRSVTLVNPTVHYPVTRLDSLVCKLHIILMSQNVENIY